VSEDTVENEAALRHVLDGITFAPSCLNMGWTWQIETLPGRGWLVNTTFRRPDTHSGEIGMGTGRKEFVPIGATESAVVKTCWLLAELIVRHELMEAFLYQGVRIFDPHHSVADLSMPAWVRTHKSTHAPVLACASLPYRITGCTCGWRVPADARDAEEAHSMHVATETIGKAP